MGFYFKDMSHVSQDCSQLACYFKHNLHAGGQSMESWFSNQLRMASRNSLCMGLPRGLMISCLNFSSLGIGVVFSTMWIFVEEECGLSGLGLSLISRISFPDA